MDSTAEEPILDDDPLTLSASTLSALTSFIEEKSEAQRALATLSAQAYYSVGHNSDNISNDEAITSSELLSPQTFKNIFKEDWQLSQFWYTEDTANRLAKALLDISGSNSRLAFICCPTGYVAFRRLALPTQNVLLLEYDTRFAMFSKSEFVHYDLDEPLEFLHVKELKASQDVLVIDPPFHSEASQRKIASTAAHILRPGGCVVLLTGTSLTAMIDDIYSELPKLHRRSFFIEHDGIGRLATSYSCWVGGGWKNDAFGVVMDV